MENSENQSHTENISEKEISDLTSCSEEKMYEEQDFEIVEPKNKEGQKSGLGKSIQFCKKSPRTGLKKPEKIKPVKKIKEKSEKKLKRDLRNQEEEQPRVQINPQMQLQQQQLVPLQIQPQHFDPFQRKSSQRAQNNNSNYEQNFEFLFSDLPVEIQEIICQVVLKNITNVKFIRKEKYCGFQCYQKETGSKFTEYVWRCYHQYDKMLGQFKVLPKYEATGQDIGKVESDKLRLHIDQL